MDIMLSDDAGKWSAQIQTVIVPEDAASLDVETIDFGDTNQSLICVCIYAGFQRKNGNYS